MAGPVRALHVVGEDLELRLRSTRALSESSRTRFARAESVSWRAGRTTILPCEHRVRRAADDALVELPARPVRAQVIHQGMRVGELAARNQREPVHRHLPPFACCTR